MRTDHLRGRTHTWAITAAALLAAAGAGVLPAATMAAAQPDSSSVEPTGVDKLADEAAAVQGLVTSDLAEAFCAQAAKLPRVEGTRVLYMGKNRTWFSEEAAGKMTDEERGKLRRVEMDEYKYYTTFYGSSLAFARALELAATSGGEGKPGLASLEGKRVLDYGYGAIGHLRMMAQMGAHVTGVEVEEALPLLYNQPGDTGAVKGEGGKNGSVRLVHGRWPADTAAKQAVAEGGGKEGYDLIVSKNTLKNGYLNPAQPVDKRMLVDLGVSQEEFLRTLHDSLKPGGLVVIFNLSPKQNEDPAKYIPWADGRCPFSREMLEKAGFEVVVHDQDETAKARELGYALEWDKTGMDLEGGLFGHATILRRPAKEASR